MPNENELAAVELQLTKEILKQFFIPDIVMKGPGGQLMNADHRITEYCKHFRRLWKVIHEPGSE